MLATILASGGITFRAELPSIWVKAEVVRIRALISPPLFLPSRSSTQPKHHRLAKIIRYRGVEYRPRVSNISAAGLVMCMGKGWSSTFLQAAASTPTGVWGLGAEA